MASMPARPTSRSSEDTSAAICSLVRSVWMVKGNPTFSPTLMESNRAESWKQTPYFLRTSVSSASPIATMS